MSTLKVNAIQNTSGVQQYLAKAWVNFNGQGTVAIRASGNVTSITDNGTGDYTVNFTSAIADVNYAVLATMGKSDINAKAAAPDTGFSTTSVRIFTGVSNGTIHTQLEDAPYCGVAVFR